MPQIIINLCTGLGILVLIRNLLRLLHFVYTYLPIHDSDINKYLWPTHPYAVVTGATDGVGRALAAELCGRGFNVIIHGRNETKLQDVKRQLRAAHPNADIRIMIADVNLAKWDWDALLEPLQGLEITVLANVVGKPNMFEVPVDLQSEEDIAKTISMNALFPLHLTRALLPSLRATSKKGPVIVVSLGSMNTEVMSPHLGVYASCKTFVQVLMRGMGVDERHDSPDGKEPNLSFKWFQVGGVNSGLNPTRPRIDVPTSAEFARDIVRRICTPGRYVYPNVVHRLQGALVAILPESAVERLAARAHQAIQRDIQASDAKRD